MNRGRAVLGVLGLALIGAFGSALPAAAVESGNGATVSFKQIDLERPPGAGADEVRTLIAFGETIREAVSGCADFDELGRELGLLAVTFERYPIERLPADLKNLMGRLDVGAVGEPLESARGVRLVMVCDRSSPPKVASDPAARVRLANYSGPDPTNFGPAGQGGEESQAPPGAALPPGPKTGMRLRAGDVVAVKVDGEDAFAETFQVDRRGRLFLPEIGEVVVAGKTLGEVRERIREALAKVYRDLDQFDIVVRERRLLLTVLGYVQAPGPIELPGDGTLQTALSAAGGLMPGAQLDRLQIRRGEQTLTFDYQRYLSSGDDEIVPTLRTLDVVFVPASHLIGNVQVDFNADSLAASGDGADDRNAIRVFGEVNRPGSFAFKPGMSVVDMLMRAGGVTRYAGVEQIRVIHRAQPAVFDLQSYLDTGDKALIPPIGEGATIFVPMRREEIRAGAHTVYVMGEVFSPGAFETKPGASFLDILANAGGPTRFADSRQMRILRADGTVEPFDLQRHMDRGDGTPLPAIRPGDAIYVPEKTDMNEKSWLKVAPERAIRIIGAVNRPGRYEWSDEMSLLDLIAHAGGPTSRAEISDIQIIGDGRDGATAPAEFDLAAFIAKGGDIDSIPAIRAGYTVIVPELPRDPVGNRAQWTRQSSDRSIYVMGQVGAPGRYAFNPSFSFLDVLSAAEGPTAKADLHRIRISHRNGSGARVTKLNLALYFETGDESLLPGVLPGDVIFVPDRDRSWLEEEKEETVRVLGAVGRPGRYRFSDDMTILDLLAEAGGPTADAYQEKIVVVNLSCCKDEAKTFDLVRFAQTGDFSRLPVVRPGDTVYVPPKSQSEWRIFMNGVGDAVKILSVLALVAAL